MSILIGLISYFATFYPPERCEHSHLERERSILLSLYCTIFHHGIIHLFVVKYIYDVLHHYERIRKQSFQYLDKVPDHKLFYSWYCNAKYIFIDFHMNSFISKSYPPWWAYGTTTVAVLSTHLFWRNYLNELFTYKKDLMCFTTNYSTIIRILILSMKYNPG